MSSDEEGYPQPHNVSAKDIDTRASQLWLLEAVATWKARADAAEARADAAEYATETAKHYEEFWKERADAAEARAKELEAIVFRAALEAKP